jgi:hypothetical protein
MQNNPPLTFNFEYQKNSINNSSIMSNVIVEEVAPCKEKKIEGKYEEDSLSFSRDKSK